MSMLHQYMTIEKQQTSSLNTSDCSNLVRIISHWLHPQARWIR